MFPLQWAVYKGTGGRHGAIQFNKQGPHYFKDKEKDFTGAKALGDNGRPTEGWKAREGCIFMDITSTKEGQKNVYDWERKITIALSLTDMGKILKTLVTGEECKILHDPGAKTEQAGIKKKFLTVTSPQGTMAGVIVSVTETAAGDKRTHNVPMTGDEVLVLRALLQSAIPSSLGW